MLLSLLPSDNVQHDLQHGLLITFPKEENLGNKRKTHAPNLPLPSVPTFGLSTPFLLSLLLPSHYVLFLNPKLHPSSIPTPSVWVCRPILFAGSHRHYRGTNHSLLRLGLASFRVARSREKTPPDRGAD